MKKLNLKTWNREEHFHWFKGFEEPFFGVCQNVDCTKTYQFCKENGISFFAFYLFLSNKAINVLECFRYRIKEDEVLIYDQVHTSTTIGRSDNTFGLSFVKHEEVFSLFNNNLQSEKIRVQQTTGLAITEKFGRIDVIHYTALPWTQFTSMSHARKLSGEDSCPKIAFGKYYRANQKLYLPVQIHVHHALMDAVHVAEYFKMFQKYLWNPTLD
ncbi:MAG: chloramphenicol O-acetyltransferase type A [Cyclobacteriaceae bacterium]|jgi:chloramphenicol O-acetyltransferase type A